MEYVPGQVLIRFKRTVTRAQISDFYAEYGLSEKDNLDNDLDDADQGAPAGRRGRSTSMNS